MLTRITFVDVTAFIASLQATYSPARLPQPWLLHTNLLKLNAWAPAMTVIFPRVARTRWIPQHVLRPPRSALPRSHRTQMNAFSCCCCRRNEAHGNDSKNTNSDPRVNDLGRAIEDDFATIRETYGTLPSPFCIASQN